MRKIVRRLLKKYDYPPDEAKEALEVVMKQVELMCSNESATYDGMLNSDMVAEDKAKYDA